MTNRKRKRRVYIDMDGVIVDFDKYKNCRGLTGDQCKVLPNVYFEMEAFKGAIQAVREIIAMGYEVHIATKPPTGIAHAYADKVRWILKNLPELEERITITHDKGMLGDRFDFLIDDRPHKANCEAFEGTLIKFHPKYFDWEQVLELLNGHRRTYGIQVD